MSDRQQKPASSPPPARTTLVRTRLVQYLPCALTWFCWALFVTPATATELGASFSSTNRQLQLTLTGGTGRWHRIEVSTNLLDWRSVTMLCQTNATSTWTDSVPTNVPRRFYRSQRLTALDLYVAAPDTNYSYTVLSTNPGAGQTTYVLELTSQAWLTTNEVNRPLWKHWLLIVKPASVTNKTGLLFINGGNNSSPTPPTSGDSNLRQIALDTQTIVAELKMVPNQPLTFAGEGTGRWEDALIAYTWDKFLRTGDDRWPARLPMTKAAVRAMDAVTAFSASAAGGGLPVGQFVVAGASKRGWTAWCTAAVDERVVAVVPMVIDILNVEVSMAHHHAAYGFWAPAIQDYVNLNIPGWFGTPQFQALMEIEDPFAYRGRLTLPKFEINATGDQFFLPDSAQFYFHELKGVKYLRYLPNTDHALNADAWVSLKGCYQSVLFDAPLPQFTWSLPFTNLVRVVASTPPSEVRLWQATNAVARDFRLLQIGAAWTSSVLPDQGGGVYIGAVPVPAQGWRAFFVELTFLRSGGLAPLKFTTQVYVVPDTLPYTVPQGRSASADRFRAALGASTRLAR